MKNELFVGIQDEKIVISLPISLLPHLIQCGEFEGYKVTDAKVFAQDVLTALQEENEIGETVVMQLLDSAFEDAIESGSLGIAECTVTNLR